MLKARIMTALILIPLVIGALFLPNHLFSIVLGLFTVLAAWEFAQLIKLTSFKLYAYILCLLVLYIIGLFIPLAFLIVATLWWLFASCLLLKYPLGQKYWQQYPWLPPLVGALMIVPAMIAVIVLHQLPHGAAWVIFLFLIVWSADTGAYFAGRYFGKQPLAPLISPKKTIQGLYGGFIMTVITTSIFMACWHFSLWRTPIFFVLILLTFMLSVVGDLVESGIKRWVDVKDSGKLLPGHGGILDRIDSLLAAAPIFALGVIYIH